MELLQHRLGSLMTYMYWKFGCVFHDTLQRSTLQRKWKHCKYGMNFLVIKISAMLWKCSSNMVLMWKQTKNIVTVVLWEKQIGRAFGTRRSRPSKFGEHINTDVCGPMTETSVGGVRYCVCFKDDNSKFRRVFFITTKSEVSVCLRKFLKEVKTAGHVTKVLLSDAGKESNCETVPKVLKEHGITHQLTVTYTPEQNGAEEQENRTTVEWARSMLHASGLPKELWAEACNAAYTFSIVLDLHQWKVRCLWNSGLDLVQHLVTCAFLRKNVMCIFPNIKGTNGTKRVGWV